MCLYEQLVMYLGPPKNPRQKKWSSVNEVPAGCVVRIAGALWCVVVSQVFVYMWYMKVYEAYVLFGQSTCQFPRRVKILRAPYPSIPDVYGKYCGKSMCQFPISAHPTDPSQTPRIRLIYLHIPHINTCDTTTHHNAPAMRTTQPAGNSFTLDHFFWLGRRVYTRYGGCGAKGAQHVDQSKSGSGRRTGGYARGTSAVPKVSKG